MTLPPTNSSQATKRWRGRGGASPEGSHNGVLRALCSAIGQSASASVSTQGICVQQSATQIPEPGAGPPPFPAERAHPPRRSDEQARPFPQTGPTVLQTPLGPWCPVLSALDSWGTCGGGSSRCPVEASRQGGRAGWPGRTLSGSCPPSPSGVSGGCSPGRVENTRRHRPCSLSAGGPAPQAENKIRCRNLGPGRESITQHQR